MRQIQDILNVKEVIVDIILPNIERCVYMQKCVEKETINIYLVSAATFVRHEYDFFHII